MISRLYAGASTLVLFACASLPLCASARTVSDNNLPIVDIVPNTSFTTTGNGYGKSGDPFSTNGSLSNGSYQIDGSVTIPIYRGLAATYEKDDPSLINASLQGVAIGNGAYAYPGSSRDLLQHYHIDERIPHWDFVLGLGSRTRLCCPASNDPHNPSSFEWHQGYLGATYISSPIHELGGTTLVLALLGLTSNHHPSPAALAAEPPGLDIGNRREFATTQVASAIVPIGGRHGITISGTFIWGAFDTYENAPFPWSYDTFVFSLTKRVNSYFAFTLRDSLGTERNLGSPEPYPNVIKASDIALLADIHLDFKDIFGRSAAHPAATK